MGILDLVFFETNTEGGLRPTSTNTQLKPHRIEYRYNYVLFSIPSYVSCRSHCDQARLATSARRNHCGRLWPCVSNTQNGDQRRSTRPRHHLGCTVWFLVRFIDFHDQTARSSDGALPIYVCEADIVCCWWYRRVANICFFIHLYAPANAHAATTTNCHCIAGHVPYRFFLFSNFFFFYFLVILSSFIFPFR